MVKRTFLMTALGCCVLAVGVAPAGAQAGAEARQTVTISVDNAPLGEVVRLITSEAAGISVVCHKDVSSTPISIGLDNVPVMTALNVIAQAHDLVLTRLSEGILMFERQNRGMGTVIPARPTVDPPRLPGLGGGAPAGDLPPIVRAGGDKPSVPVVPPADGAPMTLDQFYRSTPNIRVPGVAEPHDRQPLAQAAAVARRGPSVVARIPVQYETASHLATTVFGRTGVKATGERISSGWMQPVYTGAYLGDTYHRDDRILDHARQMRSSSRPQQAQWLEQTQARFESIRDQFGLPGGNQPGVGQPGAGGAGGAGQAGSIFQIDGLDELVGYDLISALIARGSPEAIEQLRELVELFDQPPQQIEVEARFVTLSVSQAQALGITWTVTDGTNIVSGNTPSGGGASIAFQTATGNFQTFITAILRQNRGKIVNAPRVATQNGQPAYVSFTQDIPVTTSTTTITDNVSTVQTQIDVFSATTGLAVVPRVTGQPPNESITTVITPIIQDVVGFVDNPGGGTIPIIASQDVQTTLRVPNGGTIALGGLVRKNNSSSTTKIPILGDLPFIGNLFRNRTRNEDESELLIFITPRILREQPVPTGPATIR